MGSPHGKRFTLLQAKRTQDADCASCYPGYKLIETSCQQLGCDHTKCQSCVAQAKRTTNQHCYGCYPGEHRVGSECKKWSCTSSDKGAGCASCAAQIERSSDATCASCNKGYYLAGTECKPFGCITGDTGTTCKTCAEQDDRLTSQHCATCHPGYHAVAGVCVAWGCDKEDKGPSCQTCVQIIGRTSEKDCASCNDGYYQNSKRCKPYGCDSATSGTKCNKCVVQESRTSGGTCASCNPGHYLDTDTDQCQAYTCDKGAAGPLCAECLPQAQRMRKDHCIVCNPGHRLHYDPQGENQNGTNATFGYGRSNGTCVNGKIWAKTATFAGGLKKPVVDVNNTAAKLKLTLTQCAHKCNDEKGCFGFESAATAKTTVSDCTLFRRGVKGKASTTGSQTTCWTRNTAIFGYCVAYDCDKGPDTGCTDCVAAELRTSDATCSACNSGYHLTKEGEGRCIPFTCQLAKDGCKSCIPLLNRTSDSDCASCHKGYLLKNETCAEIGCADNCGTCIAIKNRKQNQSNCQACNPGSKLVPDKGNACVPYTCDPLTCLICKANATRTADNQCDFCFPGYEKHIFTEKCRPYKCVKKAPEGCETCVMLEKRTLQRAV